VAVFNFQNVFPSDSDLSVGFVLRLQSELTDFLMLPNQMRLSDPERKAFCRFSCQPYNGEVFFIHPNPAIDQESVAAFRVKFQEIAIAAPATLLHNDFDFIVRRIDSTLWFPFFAVGFLLGMN
jgi:hypothetical protein